LTGNHRAARRARSAECRRCNRVCMARAVAAVAALLAAATCAVGAARKPTRIVSVNLCTDELVLRLADRKNIASVTWLAGTSSASNVADLATQIPVNHGLAEEVIPLDPDLVVAGIYTARAAVALLKQTRIPVLDLDVPNNLNEIRAQYRRVGQALGEQERAEHIIAEMDSRLAAIPVNLTSPRPRAMVFNPNGRTAGKTTLTDEIITRAGMENLSATLGINRYTQIPLETVVTNAVDVLILSEYRDGPPAIATEVLRHPVLAKISDRTRIAVVPNRLWGVRRTRKHRCHRIAQQCGQRGAPAGDARMSQVAVTGALGRERVPSHRLLVTGLSILVLLLTVASLSIGYAPLDVKQAVLDVLGGRHTLAALVLVELRLPRALLGGLVGFSLGMTGAAMQGLLRNPLAEPGIIGVSASAALGAVMMFYFGLAGAFSLALPLGGVAGAFVATLLLFVVARRGAGTMTLILTGVAIRSLADALTFLALNLAANPFSVTEILFWLMGSFADRGLPYISLVLPLMAVGWGLIGISGPSLDALTLGEETATSLGVNLPRLRLQLIAGTAFAVGSAVAVTGSIGFVGLVVPHILRPLVAHRPGRLLLVSGLGGAALTLAADIGVRLLPVQPELKLGVVTAIIGAPFLFSLIFRLRREE
jgi:iron complex transport system permease protein